ncbi:hypothetical protein BRD05_09525 [Halobacteriales archaeon QS_9_70_65]|nr:MAG: hypothetical protein BRD05_09525 [Halobacteriales archaeon QS_9_70_65]
MSRSTPQRTTALLVVATLVVVGGLAVVVAAGPAAADQHEKDEAPTYNTSDGEVKFEITFPDQTDHYPGDHPVHSEQDGHNASITYFSRAGQPIRQQGGEDGIYLDYIELDTAGFIDYSECTTSGNTAEFGVDRGSDNTGFQSDESLLEHRERSPLEKDGLRVYFFDWDAFGSGNVPPYFAPRDTVVARQGKGSRDGPCLKMSEEPGWYRVKGYANGTISNKCNDRPKGETDQNSHPRESSECEPDPKERIGLNLNSNYQYICECDSEQEARQKLGPPPNEDGETSDGGGEEQAATPTPTPTPAPTATPTPVPTEAGPGGNGGNDAGGNGGNNAGGSSAGGNDEVDEESGQSAGGNGGSGGGQATQTQQQQNGGGGNVPADEGTPTISDGPGFTPLVTLAGLLAAALLVYRRR